MTSSLRSVRLSNPLIVAVPLHNARERWRGFNQAALLARRVADFTLYDYAEPLERTRNTPQQARSPGRTERLDALADAFRVLDESRTRCRDIILVDDVCTTGATLNTCAQVLKDAGASSVHGLVFARTQKTGPS